MGRRRVHSLAALIVNDPYKPQWPSCGEVIEIVGAEIAWREHKSSCSDAR